MMIADSFEAAVTLLQHARYGVALTGAGISTHSGIPDFRSPSSGLWEHDNPAEVASLHSFKRNPKRFYNWIRPLASMILEAEPNPAHSALVCMEAVGKLTCVITQNIDMLHSRAGSQIVYELHGHLRQVTCLHCSTAYSAQPYIKEFLENNLLPCCPACDHILKPGVILFGEQLPAQTLIDAQHEARRCDVMLIAGSSLEVYPAAELPRIARQFGASIIIVDLLPTTMDASAQVVIRDDVVTVLPRLAAALEGA